MESFLCVWGYSFLQQFFNNHILQNNFPVVFGYIKREYLCNFRSKINEITTADTNVVLTVQNGLYYFSNVRTKDYLPLGPSHHTNQFFFLDEFYIIQNFQISNPN